MVDPSFSLMTILTAAAVAILSSVVAFVMLHNQQQNHDSNRVLFVLSAEDRSNLLNHGHDTTDGDMMNKMQDIRRVFEQEGYVIVRGLLDSDMLTTLDQAGKVFIDKQRNRSVASGPQTFSALKFGPIYLAAPSPLPSSSKSSSASSNVDITADNTSDETAAALSAFRNVSVYSAIPSFIAQVLLDLNSTTSTLRVLKDVFLAKGIETNYCGWHVDDQSFWPIQYSNNSATTPTSSSLSSPPGVNAWIALDDIPAKYGGGLAVSPRSHVAVWKEEAYNIIGSIPTYPAEGYDSPQAMMERYQTSTCNLADVVPQLSQRIDDTMHVFDFQKGDVLFHTRWLFHRSVPITQDGIRYYKSLLSHTEEGKEEITDDNEQDEPITIRRYSIRYEVGNARLLRGFTIEPSMVLQPEFAGRTLDEISPSDDAEDDDGSSSSTNAPWYPRCWPNVSEREMTHLYEIVQDKLPTYEPIKQELIQQMLPYFRRRTRE